LQMFGRWVWDAWLIANALEKGAGRVGFWDEGTGFYHDVIERTDGTASTLQVFSMQALVPLFASISIPVTSAEAVQTMRQLISDLASAYEHTDRDVRLDLDGGNGTHYMLAMVHHDRLAAILQRVLDPQQFLSAHGIRSLSKYHRDQPYVYHLNGQ